jgi:hypothetical protein
MTSSNLVGCSIGRSPRFAPLRIFVDVRSGPPNHVVRVGSGHQSAGGNNLAIVVTRRDSVARRELGRLRARQNINRSGHDQQRLCDRGNAVASSLSLSVAIGFGSIRSVCPAAAPRIAQDRDAAGIWRYYDQHFEPLSDKSVERLVRFASLFGLPVGRRRVRGLWARASIHREIIRVDHL